MTKKRKKYKKNLISFLFLLLTIGIIVTLILTNTNKKEKPVAKIDNDTKIIEELHNKSSKDDQQIQELITYTKEKNIEINDQIIELFNNENFIISNLEKYIEYQNKTKSQNTIEIVNNNLDSTNETYQYEIEEFLLNLIKEKYYLQRNLTRYINYYLNNKELDSKEIVTRVNSNLDSNFYENIEPADTSKDTLIIVNKHYKLDDNFVPENLVATTTAGYGLLMRKDAYDAFLTMLEAANKEGCGLFIISPYRSIADQRYIYNGYVSTDGVEKADTYSARPGHSEHNTGLAIDIGVKIYDDLDAFENTPSFYWMQENAHKYGYILRYPKGKEYITGYIYEPWHYRYVGVEAATTIHNENITFEEYYEYYVKNK